jgi:hypothetical protein
VLSAAAVLAANLTSYAYVEFPRVGAWNALIWLGFFLIVAAIVRELRVFQVRLQRLSRVDSLTGVSNRMAFIIMNLPRAYTSSSTIFQSASSCNFFQCNG